VGDVVNRGNPEEVSITNLARMVIAITGANVQIDYIPYDRAYEQGFEDMERRVPDIRKVVACTGYSPKVGLDQAIRFTRDWFVNEKILEQAAVFEHST
jgi:UDP-glucose 4-epimerase